MASPLNNEITDLANLDGASAITVAIVEDDERFREALAFQLTSAKFEIEAFPTAESFLESPAFKDFDCGIVDICLPKRNGLQLLSEVKRADSFTSIIFVTGCGDMSLGIQAMREGAIDCLEKPIDDDTLLNTLRRAAKLAQKKRIDHLQRIELRQREETLTPREREVFGLVTNGLLNKQVGATLGATERTIKTHRGRVMNKMNADSLADLVRMAELLQIHLAVPPGGNSPRGF
jgi:FixJ family two-component response regulator